jgi:hypothetical protein
MVKEEEKDRAGTPGATKMNSRGFSAVAPPSVAVLLLSVPALQI